MSLTGITVVATDDLLAALKDALARGPGPLLPAKAIELVPCRYAEARALVFGAQKASTSFIQRTMGIRYNEAARLIQRMEDEGFVSDANHIGVRTVLASDLRRSV